MIVSSVVTAPADKVQELTQKGYVCVPVFSDIPKLPQIPALKLTEPLKTHFQAGDYLACSLLVHRALSRYGAANLMRELVRLCGKQAANKVAFVSGGYNNTALRHYMALWLLDNNYDVTEYGVENYDAFIDSQRALVETDTYKNTGIEIISDVRLAEALENHKWIFAKTMVKHPHLYTLRKGWDEKEWVQVYLNIREKGAIEVFYEKVYRVFYASNGWKYWTMPCGFHKGTKIAGNIVLINKAKIQ